MNKWDRLSMQQKADLMKIYVKGGVTNIGDIKKHYNSFAPGGSLEGDKHNYPIDIAPAIIEADYPRESEVWKKADASNADIIKRLKQGSSRATIPDWEYPNKVATHKMMSAGKYVVGNVQNINGQLFDFTDPKHRFKDSGGAAIDSAIERGDYVEFDTEGDARYFAEHYKKHYNSFGDGGDKNDSNLNSKVDSQSSKEWLTNWVANRPLEQMAQQQLKDISEQKQWYQSDDPSLQKLNLQEDLLQNANNRKEYIEELLGRTQEFTVGDIIDNYNSNPLYTALGARTAAKARRNMGRRESFTIDLGKGTSESNSYTTKDYLEHFDDSKIKGITFTTPNTNSGFYRNPTIVYSNKYFNSPSTQTHELNHVLHSPQQGIYNAMGLNKGLVKDVNVNLNTGHSTNNYLDNLEEIHSRIMQVRKAANLSPEKFNYTPEEAKSIIRDYGEGLNLDRYTPETLSEFLNNFAYNTRVATESNTNKRVAKYGGVLNKFESGGQTENDFNGINPFTNNSVFHSKDGEKIPLLREEELPFEHKYYPLSLDYNRPWYNETIDNYGVQKLIAKDKEGKYYGLDPKYEKYLNKDGLNLVTKEELRQKRKDIDYIGGTEEEVAVKILNKLPKLQNLVDSLSNVYGVDNNILYERLAQEGLLSRYANIYNVLPANRQKDGSIEKELFSPDGVNAFYDLGLDTAGEHLEKGHYNMRWTNPELGYNTIEIENEKGELQTSVEVPNIQSGIEILAAHLEYLQNKAKRKKPTSTKTHINNTINTMYNIGEYHKDVMDSSFVDSKYSVTNWKKLLNK